MLVCLQPFAGHVNPALPLLAGLVTEGHEVVVMTGRAYRQAVADTGAVWHPLPPGADSEDEPIRRRLVERTTLGPIARLRDDLRGFLAPLVDQCASIDTLVAEREIDVVVADPMFFGALPLALRPSGPPVLVLGLLPLMLPGGPLRSRLEHRALIRLLAPVQRFAVEQAAECGARLDRFFMFWTSASDGILQLTCPGFEHERPGLTTPVHFVGPITRSDGPLPSWWGELPRDRPVVVVTQGTVANADPGELVAPALEALADEPVAVVVTTGGGAAPTSVPSNARVADHLPFDTVFPRADLLLTNGGYGGVQLALRHGLPIGLVGATEDKAEVLARIRLSGVGAGIRTRHPSPQQVRRLVRRLLDEPSYAARSRDLREEIARCPGLDGAVRIVTEAAAAH